MAMVQSQSDYRVWPVEGLPLRVEFSMSVLEEICASAVDGLYRFRHGGVEVGGALYGAVTREAVRIVAYRPLECEHAFGPRFVLSERDRAEMKRLLEAPAQDPDLRGMTPLGWYHSHTRSEISLSPRDLEIHDRFFTQPTHIALIVRPESYESCRAGFFVREFNGRLRTDASFHEFALRPRRHGLVAAKPGTEAHAAPASAPAPPPAPAPVQAPPPSTPAAAAAPRPAPPEPQTEPEPESESEPYTLPSFAEMERTRSYRWLWLVAGLVFALLGGYAYHTYYGFTDTRPQLNLWVADIGGQLLIDWDRSADPVRNARWGRLEIMDGKEKATIAIPKDRLREGSIDYVRRGDMLDVRLTLEQSDGRKVTEVIRFIGQPVNRPPTPEIAEALRERDALKAEVEKLRDEIQRRGTRRRARPPVAAPKP